MLRLLFVLPFFAAGCVAADTAALRREADARALQSSTLVAALADREPGPRREAAAAMGRTGSKLYAPSLRRALRDPDVPVRFEAAFSLGQLWIDEPLPAEPEVAADLVPLIIDAEPRVRAAAVEALGKLGSAELEPRFTALLSNPEAAVRREAAAALFRLRYLKRITAYSSATIRALTEAFGDFDPETRWRAAYAFSRWPEPFAAEALSRAAQGESPWVRLFALRGLAQLKTAAPEEPLRAGLADPDERVRTEAAALAKASAKAGLLTDRVIRDPCAHVRAAAADALGNAEGDLQSLETLAKDRSSFVRGQAVASLAKRLGDTFEERLAAYIKDADPRIRSRACAAAGELPKAGAKLLDECLRDEDAQVKAAALEVVGERPGADADIMISVALSDPNTPIEVAGTAMDAVSKRNTPELVGAVIKAYKRSQGREWVELRESAVAAAEHLAALAPDDARLKELRQSMLKDPAYSVRAKAHASLKLEAPPKGEPATPPRLLNAPQEPDALVSLETDRGVILLSLSPEGAPAHAASFLELVRKGFYDGTTFHRVVSNFVVQGGDPRGSGWGDPGYSLGDEINPMKFARGTVGMAKAGKDTGGCQLFIALVPTPHLDGRYTAFGRVVGGMDVVDRLMPGDVIRKARVR